MSNGKEKLARDLEIIEGMAAEMPDYLDSQVLFWPKIDNKLVQPTLGGFWLRRHRLEVLQKSLLGEQERNRLRRVVQEFDQACAQQRQRAEVKAGQEVEARLRQWAAALEELLEDEVPSLAYYRSDVEIRAIIEILLTDVTQTLIERKDQNREEISRLDEQLEQRWETGEFVWPTEWTPAYPQPTYWWLYGELKPPEY